MEKIAEWMLSKFREQKPWTEELVRIINKDLADSADHINLQSALARIIRTKLQNVKTDDDLYKILQKANQFFDENSKSVSLKAARKACIKSGDIIVPPGITLRTMHAFASCCVTLWENRPHCPTLPRPSCPSGETVKRAAICLFTANHCCGFFASSSQQSYEKVDESSQGTPLLNQNGSSSDD